MHILTPHISCVVNEQEFEEALKSFQDIYVITGFGKILRHIKLKGNRFIRIQVDSIPGLNKEDLSPAVKEEINFLPAGKLPVHLLDEIVQFFRQVMTIKKAEQEAMAHVLWNEKDKDSTDRGYRIAIPNQTVSKASVKYEHDHIERGDIIVLDIHSHNTMGAFFSGTDDNDDKKGIFFSGVVGNLDRREPEFKWRLNINETKRSAEIEDIFDVTPKNVNVPEAWLDKVKTDWGTSPGKWSAPAGSWDGETRRKNHSAGANTGENRFSRGYNYEMDYPWKDGVADLYTSDDLGHNESFPGSFSSTETEVRSSKPVLLVAPNSLSASDVKTLEKKGVTVDQVESLPLFRELNRTQSSDDKSGEYHAHAIEHGKEAAEAYEQIGVYITDLEGRDELLLNIMTTCYQLLSYQGQEKLATKGF